MWMHEYAEAVEFTISKVTLEMAVKEMKRIPAIRLIRCVCLEKDGAFATLQNSVDIYKKIMGE